MYLMFLNSVVGNFEISFSNYLRYTYIYIYIVSMCTVVFVIDLESHSLDKLAY